MLRDKMFVSVSGVFFVIRVVVFFLVYARNVCARPAHLVYEPERDQLAGQRGRGVAAGDGARELAVHLVVHAQQHGERGRGCGGGGGGAAHDGDDAAPLAVAVALLAARLGRGGRALGRGARALARGRRAPRAAVRRQRVDAVPAGGTVAHDVLTRVSASTVCNLILIYYIP